MYTIWISSLLVRAAIREHPRLLAGLRGVALIVSALAGAVARPVCSVAVPALVVMLLLGAFSMLPLSALGAYRMPDDIRTANVREIALWFFYGSAYALHLLGTLVRTAPYEVYLLVCVCVVLVRVACFCAWVGSRVLLYVLRRGIRPFARTYRYISRIVPWYQAYPS